MSSRMVDKIAQAVLYEGYLLYPYRQSALKNQQRWNFGVLYPPSWVANQTGSDRSYFEMECLAKASREGRLDVSLRFLQLVARRTGEQVWQEALEQTVSVHSLSPAALGASPRVDSFSFPGTESLDPGKVCRISTIKGQIEISATPIGAQVFRLSVRAQNTTSCPVATREEALMHSLASAHTVLRLQEGEFISQTDPPEDFREAAAACQNTGVWPVLAGDSGARDTMLGSPIILYDYPQVAPESAGDLFDATEIDEILVLRILTLSDAEKEELRRSDDRARRILERLEESPPERLLALHGTIRGMRRPQADAWSAWDTVQGDLAGTAVPGTTLTKGDRVRLRPRRRADIFDTLLDNQTAIIEAVEEDFEHKIHFAVVLEDDPGRDMGEMRQAGHRFFFSAEEIEPI
ncbi:MAG TPA: hypothetical protein VLJ11_08450 [Bryobacteraceae bacterium]|nr:hypothetical protein [Bryobacteraceae bacterium]